MAARQWTDEQRQRQREAIQRWKPWAQSTGPRTAEGKAKASRNGDKGGLWAEVRDLSKMANALLKEQREMLRLIHDLPGTTFSNPRQRSGYDADATACLTMTELQRWLALAVAAYHGQVHSTLRQPPAARWAAGIATTGAPATYPTVTVP